MNNLFLKNAILLLCAFLLIVSLLLPKRAYAFFPLAVVATQIGAAAIGTALAYLALQGLSGDSVRVPLTSDPALSPPPPLAPSTSNPTVTTLYVYNSYDELGNPVQLSSDSVAGTCSQIPSLINVPGDCNTAMASTTYTFTSASGLGCNGHIVTANVCEGGAVVEYDGVYATVISQQDLTCANGYELSGSQCVLVDARAAMSDRSRDFGRSNNTLTPPASTDADAATIPGDSLTVNGAGNAVVDSVDPALNTGVLTTVIPGSNGGSTVVETTFTSTTENTRTVTVDAAGVVTGITDTSVPRTGTTPAAGTNTTVVNFPSDYAKSADISGLGTLLGGKLDVMKTDLVGINSKVGTIASAVTVTSTLDEVSTLTDADMPGFDTSFDALRGWSLPAHSSACPQPVFDLSGLGMGIHTLSSHCGLMADMSATSRTLSARMAMRQR